MARKAIRTNGKRSQGGADKKAPRHKSQAKSTSGKRALARRIRAVEEPLDRFIARRIHVGPEEFTNEEGWRELMVCGRSISVRVEEFGEAVILRVIAEVMPLPADRDLVLPLMRDALETNGMIPGGARLTIEGRTLYATTATFVGRPSTRFFETHMEEAAWMAGLVADRYIRRYSGTTRRRARGAKSTQPPADVADAHANSQETA